MDFCMGHPANGGYHYHYFAKNTEGIMIEEYNVFIYKYFYFLELFVNEINFELLLVKH